jgi:hypothetical protein
MGMGSWGSRSVNHQRAGRYRCQEARSAVSRILAAFPLLDAKQHAVTCDIRQLQPDDCTDAEPCRIRGHQEDAMPRMPRMAEETLEFLNAENLGEL